MPREEFQKQIKGALDSVLEMSSHVDRALDRAMQSLIERDVALAQTVIDGDSVIDELNSVSYTHLTLPTICSV